MRRRMLCSAGLAGAVLSAGCGGGPAGTALPRPSGALTIAVATALPPASATWVYQQTVIQGPLPVGGQSGDLTITYEGVTPYRGGNFYTIQAASAVAGPPFVTAFFTTDPATQSEFADAFFNFPIVPGCVQSPQVELVLGAAADFTAPQASVVQASSIRCGFPTVVSSSSLTVVDAGSASIATPGGTFAALVRQGSYVSFGTRTDYVDYVSGRTVVDREATFHNPDGSVMAVTSAKYKSGPLNVVFPGPPMLLAQFY